MTLELSTTERRLILQGLWKEQDMYSRMRKATEDNGVKDHCSNMIKTLDKLENKLLGW